MTGLTARQEQVLRFIREFTHANGYPPTVREIGSQLELSSPSTVHVHLGNLERLGFIRRDPSKPRALELVDAPRPLAAAAARRPGRRRHAHPRRAEHRRLRRGAGPAASQRRRLPAARRGRLHDRRRHPQRRSHRGASPGDRRQRRHRGRPGRRRGHHQALLPRGRAASACSPPTTSTSRSSSTTSSSSAGSWGCCAGYEPRRLRPTRPHAGRPPSTNSSCSCATRRAARVCGAARAISGSTSRRRRWSARRRLPGRHLPRLRRRAAHRTAFTDEGSVRMTDAPSRIGRGPGSSNGRRRSHPGGAGPGAQTVPPRTAAACGRTPPPSARPQPAGAARPRRGGRSLPRSGWARASPTPPATRRLHRAAPTRCAPATRCGASARSAYPGNHDPRAARLPHRAAQPPGVRRHPSRRRC